MPNYTDPKGKYFTPLVQKRAIAARIRTTSHLIVGQLHIHPDERVSDELNREEPFLAVTDAKIIDPDGRSEEAAAFVSINKQHIIWLTPTDARPKEEKAP